MKSRDSRKIATVILAAVALAAIVRYRVRFGSPRLYFILLFFIALYISMVLYDVVYSSE